MSGSELEPESSRALQQHMSRYRNTVLLDILKKTMKHSSQPLSSAPVHEIAKQDNAALLQEMDWRAGMK